jgi:hypothetical protein
MKRKMLRLLLLLITIVIAAALFIDANTFALAPYDPINGRSRGCYTAIEDFLQLKEPSWIRTAEFYSAILLIPLAIIIFRKTRWYI